MRMSWSILLPVCWCFAAQAQFPDCNNNGIDDADDISSGTSLDCTPHNCCDADRYVPGCSDVDIQDCVCIDYGYIPYYGYDYCCAPGAYWSSGCVSLAQNHCALACPSPGVQAGNGIRDECEIADCDPFDPDCADCNANGVPDICDIASGVSLDTYCANGIPDECENDCNCNSIADDSEILSGAEEDCDLNGVPDSCAPCAIDLVFALDVSGSMAINCSGDVTTCEAELICDSIQGALDDLAGLSVQMRVTILGMAEYPDDYDWCTTSPRKARLSDYLEGVSSFDDTVPGTPGECGSDIYGGDSEQNKENWAPSIASLAQYFDWQPGWLRVVVPISDEGPCLGSPCTSPEDGPAIANATNLALTNGVRVCPIVGVHGANEDEDCDAECSCVNGFALQIAADTGGQAVQLHDYSPFALGHSDQQEWYDKVEVVKTAIFDAIQSTIARSCGDINENGTPDACEADCNENGIPDDYEVATGIADDVNANGIPDECEVELQTDLLVVVMEEDPVPVTFFVPPNSQYAFGYDPTRVSVWDTPTRDTLIVHDPGPADELTAGSAGGTCGADLSDIVAFQICFSGDGGGPIGPECEQFDYDQDADVDAADFEVFRPQMLFPVCAQVTVYVEGESQSTDLNDTAITLLADPDYDDVLTPEEVRELTVATVTVTAASGRLGAPVTITLEPAIPPLSFDGASTITFNGVYEPPIGDPTEEFQISYNAEQVCELPPGEAVVHVGDGTVNNMPILETLPALGAMNGKVLLNLSALSLARAFSFAPQLNGATLERVYYPDGPFGLDPPTVGGALTSLPFMLLSTTPDPLNPPAELLRGADGYHVAVVARLEGGTEAALAYSNTGSVTHPISYFVPGSISEGYWIADDLRLDAPGGCDALAYEVAVYAGTSGGQFDAHVELFDLYDDLFDFPGTGDCVDSMPEGQGIPGTAMDFFDLPAMDVSYLRVPLNQPLPEQMWVYLSVSTSEAGWVEGNGPEVGYEAVHNCYGGNSVNQGCQMCFDPPNAMWSRVYCRGGAPAVCESAPPMILVDLVSYDSSGLELDRVQRLPLYLALGDDGDPTQLVYHNDLHRPIVLIDVNLDEIQYPDVVPLHVLPGGTAIIVGVTQ